MQLTGLFEYQQSCKKILNEVFRFPRIYYSELNEFKYFMTGHSVGFCEHRDVPGKQLFNTRFNEWLCQKTDSSGPSGWAYVITELAKKKER